MGRGSIRHAVDMMASDGRRDTVGRLLDGLGIAAVAALIAGFAWIVI